MRELGQQPSVDRRPAATRAVLRVEGVEKGFSRGLWPWRRRVEVLTGAGLELRAGELVGLVGENGSGKSTLLKAIVGLSRPDAGRIERSARLGYCPQVPLLWGKLTVTEHFELFAHAYSLSAERGLDAAAALMGELRFERFASYRVEELSGGTAQKLNLALALVHDPGLLLLDEPYTGFDWETYERFWAMSEARRDTGMAILIVSHMLTERGRLDRIYELRDGHCTEQAP